MVYTSDKVETRSVIKEWRNEEVMFILEKNALDYQLFKMAFWIANVDAESYGLVTDIYMHYFHKKLSNKFQIA